jgi:hypothetical protein
MARTETPLFRKALAAVALWCLVWAVLGYRNHQAVASYDQRAGYREAMERCADDQLLTSPNGDLTAHRPGAREMAACTGSVRAQYQRTEADEQRQVTWATLAWALLPSLLLLLLAGFAAELGRIFPQRPDAR